MIDAPTVTARAVVEESALAYVSLYRKYRPQTFADVVGQRHVTQTLANAIEEDRLHHAYLFTGPRGTGKTSTARILAKAVNCEQGPTPTPCNACEACVSITSGAAVDVIELDMASHGGVDDARELRERALFAPAKLRKKVYILDEVHMASPAAFNALLKLIEEPPAHVLFAMATTDPQKVLPTIMSRVQRLDLRRVGAEDVAAHVRHLVELEGYTIDDDAVDAVVRAGEGSVRDTLSILEQVLSYSGTEVDAEKVAQVLGQTPAERTFETVEQIAAGDLAGLLALVQGLLDDGHDLRRFTLDLLGHLRDLLVLQVAPDRPDLVDATAERRERVAAQADLLGRDTLLRAVDLLAGTITEMRQGPARLPLELALAKLATPAAVGDTAALADRVARLEAGAPPAPAAASARAADPAPAEDVPAPAEAAADAPAPDDTAPAPDTPDIPDAPAQAAPAGSLAERARRRAARTQTAEAAPPATEATPPPAEAPAAAASTPTEEQRAEEPDETPAETPAAADAPDAEAPAADTTAAETTPDAPADDLATVKQRWPAILDIVKESSRRVHAVYEPAEPVALSRGILVLHYPQRYASFHAQNATKGEFAATLTHAVESSCGLRVKVDTQVGTDTKRRPLPPVVTETAPPAEDGPTPDEEAAVREAELRGDTGLDGEEAMERATSLLQRELDAVPLDDED